MSDRPAPAPRGINEVTVDFIPTRDGARHIDIRWMDAAGVRRQEVLFGYTAEMVATDLHAATLMGETHRQCYLTGVIRMLNRLRGPS